MMCTCLRQQETWIQTTRNLFESLISNYANLDLILVLLHLHQKVINLPVFLLTDSFPPPPLHNAWIFQFIVKSFGLCYSLTVSEQF